MKKYYYILFILLITFFSCIKKQKTVVVSKESEVDEIQGNVKKDPVEVDNIINNKYHINYNHY